MEIINGMIDVLNQEILNEVHIKIQSLEEKYNVPKIIPINYVQGNSIDKPKLFIDKNVICYLSVNKTKCLKRLIARVLTKTTRNNANLYLRFVYKKCLEQQSTPKIKLNEKEEKIRQARKAWLKAKTESEQLRILYKTEKGSYFKS